jgi:hypothetical protein
MNKKKNKFVVMFVITCQIFNELKNLRLGFIIYHLRVTAIIESGRFPLLTDILYHNYAKNEHAINDNGFFPDVIIFNQLAGSVFRPEQTQIPEF